jgi:hypothetical protein
MGWKERKREKGLPRKRDGGIYIMYENLGQKNTFTVAVWSGHPLIFLSYERKSYQLPVLFGEEFFAVANVWFNKVSWRNDF